MRLVPQATGAATPVSTELAYCAFPYATRDTTGRSWVAYSDSTAHVAANSDVRVRWADPCFGWSLPQVVVAGDSSYGVVPGGLAADSAELGGKLWLATVRFQPTSGLTATNYTTQIRSRDPLSGDWSGPSALPAISPSQTIGTGLLVRPDGTLLAAAYGTPQGSSYQVAKVYSYDRAAGTWTTISTLAMGGSQPRHVQEPTLLTMADGRLMMLFRSDASQPYYCYLYAAISPDGGATWPTPYRVVIHGSGRPDALLLPDGQIAVTYRGFSQPTNPCAANPPRVTMLTADGTPTGEHHDVLQVPNRYLYGQFLPGFVDGSPVGDSFVLEPDRLVCALEGQDGQSGGGAAVFTVPLRWVTRS